MAVHTRGLYSLCVILAVAIARNSSTEQLRSSQSPPSVWNLQQCAKQQNVVERSPAAGRCTCTSSNSTINPTMIWEGFSGKTTTLWATGPLNANSWTSYVLLRGHVMLLLMDSTAHVTRNAQTAKLMFAAADCITRLVHLSVPVATYRDFVSRKGVRDPASTSSTWCAS
jgi:hypothetical protein